MKTDELIAEVTSLPVEERLQVVDSLLQSLNQPRLSVDKAWAEESQRRLDEIKSGKVATVDGATVFDKVWKRFE